MTFHCLPSASQVAEGAIASLVRGGDGEIEAYPITHFIPQHFDLMNRRICFFKLDVEGFELHGLVRGRPSTALSFDVSLPFP